MVRAFSKTDIGKKRQLNQDFVFTSALPLGNLPNLFIVADGMGGHKAGDYASKFTVETIVEEVGMSKETEPVKILSDAIQSANRQLRKIASEDEDMGGMGTTLVVSTCMGDNLLVANVGDSRLYVINEDIKQITRDHSLVEEMVRLGGIDRVAARNHPDKNIITRAIGASPTVNIDFFEVTLAEGDMILMCSDGLTNMIEDPDICAIVKSGGELKDIADNLIRTANNNGGKDNIAVVLVSSDRMEE
ncbi:MAG: Stp1/IreP family PP2C-type Ser/Thr phosphatase [Lachnospiraceae bacterium]|nr:Stp1/IreP family PP2C-type Ser/Thr phosphatase [Lachnospiraceae bacterium]